MATMEMVSAGEFSGVTFHLRQCPQGVAALIFEETPVFGSTGSKLDLLKDVCVPSILENQSVQQYNMLIMTKYTRTLMIGRMYHHPCVCASFIASNQTTIYSEFSFHISVFSLLSVFSALLLGLRLAELE
jgi:hypothetical protein